MRRYRRNPTTEDSIMASAGTPAIQRKLTVGATNDPLEHEADHVADKVMRMPDAPFVQRKSSGSCGEYDDEHVHLKSMPNPVSSHIQTKGTEAGKTSDAVSGKIQASKGGGQPMDAGTKSFMESRFGVDFSDVKIHTGNEPAQLSRELNAQAFTVGRDIYFNSEKYAPENSEGKRLLAHELTHVMQQKGSTGSSAGKSHGTLRRKTPPKQTPSVFSVNQATYLGLVNKALLQMSGSLINSETLAPIILPILHAMVASVVWKDANGVESGGGAIKYKLPGGVVLNLKMILNDAPGTLDGEFTRRKMNDGEMEIFIQSNPTEDDLAITMYHEAMHLISGLINRASPALSLKSTRKGMGQAGGAGTLDRAYWGPALKTIHAWLDVLASSVNPRRTTGPQISAADIDKTTNWMYEEISARIETEVFRLVQSTQQAMTTSNGNMVAGTRSSWTINNAMINQYIFEISHVFLPSDVAGLTTADQATISKLMQILEGLYQTRVTQRFSSYPYTVGSGIQFPQAPSTPTPVTPPPFTPLPVP